VANYGAFQNIRVRRKACGHSTAKTVSKVQSAFHKTCKLCAVPNTADLTVLLIFADSFDELITRELATMGKNEGYLDVPI